MMRDMQAPAEARHSDAEPAPGSNGGGVGDSPLQPTETIVRHSREGGNRFFFEQSPHEQPCIRCGDCASVCPERLDPQRLLLRLRDGRLGEAANEGALDCTLCGRCEAACPSRIPLVQRYREARQAIESARAHQQVALAARERFRSRQQRLARATEPAGVRQPEQIADPASAEAVAAAIARSLARRAARKDGRT